ncbi:MAG: S4 domain-containing protein [Patescibacteria group bacterium]
MCSRRKAEDFIQRGLVKVNGQVAEIGMQVNPSEDKVEMQ